MSDNAQSRAAGARLSNEQYDVLLNYLQQTGERPSDYVRRLIAEDLSAHGIELPDYEFIDNDMRAERRKDGIPWLNTKKP